MIFERLDGKSLQLISSVDSPEKLKNSGMLLSTVLACLDEAAKECQLRQQFYKFSSSDLEQLQRGFLSAQKIISVTWYKNG